MLTLFLLAAFAAATPEPATLPAVPAIAPVTAPAEVGAPAMGAAFRSNNDQFHGAVEVFHFGFEADEDRDFDRHPDGWIRRKGPAFPRYIEAAIGMPVEV